MGFAVFLGRVFFSALFISSAWQKNNDFNAYVNSFDEKFFLFKGHVQNIFGVLLAEFMLKALLRTLVVLEGVGGSLFTLGSSIGAYFLLIFLAISTPLMHDFYNFEPNSAQYAAEFSQFLKNLSMFGALLFFLGMKSSAANMRKRYAKNKLS
eukprot:TRINITY_DN3419_c0_g1_i1.p1 TRINITY_DN3419_c0_g1~~TRINITY_DN3419_c0_g1_i1.p1  ORF type:complete len:152 (+),score=25.03 TRINITY_DN3419_c0_g1_i1:156-611(+)